MTRKMLLGIGIIFLGAITAAVMTAIGTYIINQDRAEQSKKSSETIIQNIDSSKLSLQAEIGDTKSEIITHISRVDTNLYETHSSLVKSSEKMRSDIGKITPIREAIVKDISFGLIRTSNQVKNEFEWQITVQNFGNVTANELLVKIYFLRKLNEDSLDAQFGTISTQKDKRFQEELAPNEQRVLKTISVLPGKGTAELKNTLLAVYIEYKSEGSNEMSKKKLYYRFNMNEATDDHALVSTSVTEKERDLIIDLLKNTDR